jgi:type IV secretion system protein VirB9
MIKKLVISAAFVPIAAIAQTPLVVPAIDKTAMVAPMNIGQPSIEISPKERMALDIAKAWKEHPDKPLRSADGTVMYLFGAAMPTLICKELVSCMIRLQPGEMINDVHVGDTRWDISYTLTGSGPNATTNLIVKPLDTGLVSNIIITTDRRTYIVQLKSARHEWMPAIAFYYPDEHQSTLAALYQRQGKAMNGVTLPSGQSTANLDFNYRMSGDNPKWKPVRVYSDGVKTYIEFESGSLSGEAPALVIAGKGNSLWSSSTEQMVNYRLVGNRYVVDQVVEKEAWLISGIGNAQTKVVIQHTGGKPQ